MYGVVGLKTHAKMLLVTPRETLLSSKGKAGGKDKRATQTRLRRYAHLSTGNYNPRTARMYTDLGYLTAHAGLTADIDAVFLQLASQTQVQAPKYLVTAPLWLLFVVPGWIAWTGISIWFLYRVVRGWMNLNSNRPIIA